MSLAGDTSHTPVEFECWSLNQVRHSAASVTSSSGRSTDHGNATEPALEVPLRGRQLPRALGGLGWQTPLISEEPL